MYSLRSNYLNALSQIHWLNHQQTQKFTLKMSRYPGKNLSEFKTFHQKTRIFSLFHTTENLTATALNLSQLRVIGESLSN